MRSGEGAYQLAGFLFAAAEVEDDEVETGFLDAVLDD